MNNQLTKRRAHFFAAAAFSVLFMLLFACIIPSVKASAEIRYTVACTGGKITYNAGKTNTIVPIASDQNYVTLNNSQGNYTITVKPHENLTPRTITLNVKNGTKIIDTIKITQSAVPNPQFSISCVGGKLYYYIAGASSYNYNNTAVCSSRDGNYFVVQPHTGTSKRSCRVRVRNGSGVLLSCVDINQSGVPTYTPSRISCTGGSVSSPASGADYTKTGYSNTNVCNSINNGKFIVKTNTTTAERKCTITVRNSANRVIYYIYITQDKVPLTKESIPGGGGSFDRQYSSVSFNPTTANTISISSSAPSGGLYTYKINVYANPSTTDSRSFDIIVKNSSGGYIAIIRVTQSKFVVPEASTTISSDPQTVPYTFAGAVSSISYSNKEMFSTYTKTGNEYKFSVSQNPKTSSRENKVTFKDKNGTPIATFTVKQDKVPPYSEEVDDGCPTLFFHRISNAVSFDDVLTSKDNYAKHVSKYTALSQSQFAIEITANPSTTKSRTFDINVMGMRNNKKVILEIITVTQPPHVHYYKYTTSNHVYSRKCLYCDDGDSNISYQEYLRYNKDKNLTDCENSVKSYMNALGYGVNSTESKNMVTAYLALHNGKPLPPLLTMDEIQSGLDNLSTITYNIALFSGCDKLGKGLSIASAANHLAMFFMQDNPADKIGNAVKFAGDLLSLGTGGDYYYYALDTVGTALKETIGTVLKKQDSDFIHALYDYDICYDNYIEKLTLSQIKNNTTRLVIEGFNSRVDETEE